MHNNQAYRSASAAPFPYGMPGRCCYFEIVDNAPRHLHYVDDMRDATRRAVAGETTLYAAWPGQYRTDLFVIDKPELLAEAIHA